MRKSFTSHPTPVVPFLDFASRLHVCGCPFPVFCIDLQNEAVDGRKPPEQGQIFHTLGFGHWGVEELHTVDVDELEVEVCVPFLIEHIGGV